MNPSIVLAGTFPGFINYTRLDKFQLWNKKKKRHIFIYILYISVFRVVCHLFKKKRKRKENINTFCTNVNIFARYLNIFP